MGNWNINIQGVGSHHNTDYPKDANKMAEAFVRQLKDAGHHIDGATFTHGGMERLVEDAAVPGPQPDGRYLDVTEELAEALTACQQERDEFVRHLRLLHAECLDEGHSDSGDPGDICQHRGMAIRCSICSTIDDTKALLEKAGSGSQGEGGTSPLRVPLPDPAIAQLRADLTACRAQGEAMRGAGAWKTYLDPARPSWPGVLVAPADNSSLIHVEAGRPVNFADSAKLAEQIAAALSSTPTEPKNEK